MSKVYDLERMKSGFKTVCFSLAGLLAGCYLGVSSMLAANPLFDGWYADPEVAIYDDTYWIYPTDGGVLFDCFSSKDLVNWTKHSKIIALEDIDWATKHLWAPAAMRKGGKYYLFFCANDIEVGETGGIGVAVSDRPEGPFKDMLGKPLIGHFENGAKPIDQFVFTDTDGQIYMYYGWRHCNVVKLNDRLTGLMPFPDGSFYKELTPEHYVEGPVMFKRNGSYYFMWSEGNWMGSDYSVAYAIAKSPLGPFKRIDKILKEDGDVAKGPGHQSVKNIPGTDDWYMVYHRRPMSETAAGHRATCIDKMEFDENGHILPIKMTHEGVGPIPLK